MTLVIFTIVRAPKWIKSTEFSPFFLYFRKTNMDTSQCSWTFSVVCMFSGNQRTIRALTKIRFLPSGKTTNRFRKTVSFLQQMDFRFSFWLTIDIHVHCVWVIVIRFSVDELEFFYKIETFKRTIRITK